MANAATPGVNGIDSLRMRWIGHQLRAEISIAVDPLLNVQTAHEIAHLAEHNIRQSVPKLSEATVHVEPSNSRPDSIKSPTGAG